MRGGLLALLSTLAAALLLPLMRSAVSVSILYARLADPAEGTDWMAEKGPLSSKLLLPVLMRKWLMLVLGLADYRKRFLLALEVEEGEEEGLAAGASLR